MNFSNILSAKNSLRNRILFFLFFGFALVTETIHRYHYRAELDFKLSKPEMGLLLLIAFVVLNPRGIKAVLLGVFLFLIFLSTRSMVLFHLSGDPDSLLLKPALSPLKLGSIWVYIIHQLIYFYFSYLVIRNREKKTQVIKN